MYKFRDFVIPDHMMDGLTRYIESGIPPGHFLSAVLSNDLYEAVSRADDENVKILPAYIGYLVNEAPSNCWGSREKVKAWITEKADDRRLLDDMMQDPMGAIEKIQGKLRGEQA